MSALLTLITDFISQVSIGKIEVYNEFSLQFELGVFLRNNLPQACVEFERNVNHFFEKDTFTKKEIDITVRDQKSKDLLAVIELKNPRNGQVPEQMFSICKDICFLEELCDSGFAEGYMIAFVDNQNFWTGTRRDGIYRFFRGNEILEGDVSKPTGDVSQQIQLKRSYKVKWQQPNAMKDSRWLVLSVTKG